MPSIAPLKPIGKKEAATPAPGAEAYEEPEAREHGDEPETLETMRFVMCPPQYLSTRIKNNVWMSGEPVDVKRAMRQYRRIKNVITGFGVEVLEIPPVKGLQDQVYVANIGIAIDPYIILANYKAPGREGEVEPAREFFEGLGYECLVPPFHFEGEADLKKLNDTTYFGGHDQFTDIRAHRWIEEQTGVHIIPVREVSEELYHLDCSLFVIDAQNVLVTKAGLDRASRKTVELYANVIETPSDIASTGITNGVQIPSKKIYLSGTFNPEMPEYRKGMEWLNDTFDKFGWTPLFMDCDEYDKSGADLSCTVMHLDF